MKTSVAVLALAGAAFANPIVERQACPDSYPQTFTINNVLAPAAKRDLSSRQLDGTLRLTLSGGVLKDQAGRIGYIAANRQFQFDNPVQAGAIKQSGFTVCPDGRLRLDGSPTFYQCQSGSFYNLYDQSQGGQCQSINFQVQNAAGGAASSGASQISDGQPQATSARVSQISDGQPQATSARVSQISDGQVQATSARVSQISDGQVQATSARPAITQISDGQVQATSARPAVTQISDGQVQATSARPAVTQISDGQIQATSARPAPATFTGGARRELAGGFAFAAGIVGAIALL